MKRTVSAFLVVVFLAVCVIANNEITKIIPFFDGYVQENMELWNIPGMAVGIVKDGELVFSKGYGVKDVETGEPVTPETIFQIGSTSKAFTSFLLAQLIDRGEVNWKDRVVDHFPEFRMYDPWVTSNFLIEDLMAQHSGLPPYSGDFMAFFDCPRDEIIEKIRFIPPANTFRTDFAYQNNLFLVAGKIIENHSNLTWEENVEKEIFAVLGMDESSNTPEGYFETGNYATTYGSYNDELTRIDFDGKPFKFAYVYGPAGGINSNIVDMSKWISLQMNKGAFGDDVLLSRVQYDFLHRPATFIGSSDSKILFYCQGWIYEQRRDYRLFWHDGETLGCKTMVAYLPDDDLGIVVLSNLAGTHLPDLLAYVLFDLYKEVEFIDYSGEYLKMLIDYTKTVPEEPEITFSDPLPLENYAGIYYNDFFEKVSVSVKEGRLEMEFIGRDITFDLEFFNRDFFMITDSDLLEMNGVVVAFSIDETGIAESLTLKSELISKGLEILYRIE